MSPKTEDGSRDAGITLVEVLVSLTLMSMVMALATTGMLEIFRGTNRTEANAVVQDAFPVPHGDSLAYLALVRLELEIGLTEVDLLPLTFIPDDQLGRLLAPVTACAFAR